MRALKSTINKKEIPSLDGLRFFSILLVLIGHTRSIIPSSFQSFILFIGNQGLGVSIFFVLSGFLITRLLLIEQGLKGTISLRAFYIKRIMRIFPLYYFYILTIFTISKLGFMTVPNIDLISAILYLWNYVPSTSNWYLGHSWSLAVEEQFYILWPFIFFYLKPPKALNIALTLILLSPLLRVITYLFIPIWKDRITILFHTRSDFLFIGCALAFLYGTANWDKVHSFLKKWKVHYLSIFIIFILSPLLSERFSGSYLFTIGYSLEAISIACMIIWILELSQKSIMYSILNNVIVRHLGILSYGIYLWQQLFTHNEELLKYPFLLFSTLYLVALTTYLLVEYPLFSLRKKLI